MRLLKTTCLILAILPFLGAAAKKQYVNGTIVEVQEKTTTRVLYYQVDTPITQDDPYYEISVQIKDTVYFGRYTPMHSSDSLPEDWTVGSAVQARIERHHLALKRPGGTEMSFAFNKRPVVKPEGSSPAAAPASK
ncbi:MAG: hypothetical protein ACLP6G_03860 [Terriglobales bacterium]